MNEIDYKEADIEGLRVSITVDRKSDRKFTLRLHFPGAEIPVEVPKLKRFRLLRQRLDEILNDAGNRKNEYRWYTYNTDFEPYDQICFRREHDIVWIGKTDSYRVVIHRYPVSVGAVRQFLEFLYTFIDQEQS